MRLFVPALFLLALGCGNEGGSPAPATPAAPAPVATPPVAPPAKPATAFTCCADASAGAVVDAYVEAQAALAKDDDAAAVPQLGALQKAAAAARAGATLDEESKSLLATVETGTAAALAATDIAARRTALKPISTAVIAFARKNAGGARSMTEAYCPMAEASWLQEGGTIANPYYGASMLTCGVFK